MKKKFNLFLKASLALLLLPLLFTGCGEPPLACFSVPSKLVDQNAGVVFDNCSQFQQEGYLWDFGDGATSSVVNPTHRFIAQGEYLVSLTSLGKKEADNDVYTDIIRVGDRVLTTINITNLPTLNKNGDPWDAADGPDVQILFEDATTNTITYSTGIEEDVTLPATIVFTSTGSNIDLLPREWNIIIVDDDAGTLDTMGVASVDLETFEPSDDKTIPLSDASNSNGTATWDILYSLE